MALKLIANYSKRLGLPGYSSHQYSLCLEAEINNMDDVAGESARLYQQLQQSVDEEIQQTGFVPDDGYGKGKQPAGNGDGRNAPTNGNGHSDGHTTGEAWACSEKQQDLILTLVDQHQLDKGQVDDTAHQMFDVGVKELNKLQASGLIDRLIEDNGGRKPSRSRSRPAPPRRTYQNGGAR